MTGRVEAHAPLPPGAARAASSDRSPEDLRKIWKSSEEIEGLFVTQLLQASGMASTGLSKDSPGAGVYGGMAEEVLGGALAESADWGVARELFRSFTGLEAPHRSGPFGGTSRAGAGVTTPASARAAIASDAGASPRPASRGPLRVVEAGPMASPSDPRSHAAAARDAGADPAWPAALQPFRDAIVDSANAHGIDPLVVAAVVERESSGNPRAVSRKGAQGLMQILPGTGRDLGLADPFDPVQNVRAGTRYLARMIERFGGDLSLALAAYNAGPGAVARHGGIPPFRETIRYVADVLGRAQALHAEAASEAGSRSAAPEPIDPKETLVP